MNKPQDAIAELERLLRDEPPNPGYRNLKAVALCHTGDYEPAIDIYAELLREHPQQAPIWLSYGHALKTAGQPDARSPPTAAASRSMPDFGEAYWSLANLKTFRFDEAQLDAMRSALARPDLKRGTSRCHRVRARQGAGGRADYAESFVHYAKAMRCAWRRFRTARTTRSARLARAQEAFTADFFASAPARAAPRRIRSSSSACRAPARP